MSYVTDVIVYVGGYRADDFIDELKEPYEFKEEDEVGTYRCIELKEINMDGAGGPKGFMRMVLAGAGNYLPAEEYTMHLAEIAQRHKRTLTAIIAPEQQAATVVNYSYNGGIY